MHFLTLINIAGGWTSRIIHLLSDQHMGLVTADALVKKNPEKYKGCISLAVSRLSRIVTFSYTDFHDYTYYFVPAPWLFVCQTAETAPELSSSRGSRSQSKAQIGRAHV